MITYIKCICDFCGKEFETPLAEYNRFLKGKKKHICCSRLCANRLIGKNHIGENNPCYNSIVNTCLYCGKEYTINKSASKNSKFCCRNCQNKYHSEQGWSKINCLFCGKEILCKKGEINAGKKFCSNECSGKFKDKKIDKICPICGKHYKIHNNRADTNVVCSKECMKEWLKEYSRLPEVQERLRKQGTISHLVQKPAYTKPELRVMEYFEQNNIEFIPQFIIGGQLTADFYLPKYNCVFEVYGDYWHANPKIYGDEEGLKPLNEIQIRNKNRDIRRYKVIVKKYEYYFYDMWEYDIYNNLEKSMKGFFDYINAKIRRDYVS